MQRGFAENILLKLLGPDGTRPEEHALNVLGEDTWQAMWDITQRHRLGPVLYWRLQARPSVPLPEPMRQALEQGYRDMTLMAMTRLRDLVLLCRALSAKGIEAVALKGAYLAFNTYPQPALRPMRDLDILVRENQALNAFEILLTAGFERDPAQPGDPPAYMTANKHLPRLVAPGGSFVEVHHRLVEQSNPLAPDPEQRRAPSVDLAALPGYWDRLVTRSMGGTPVRFPDPTDLLLHLCIHAAYDDRFGGGALILFDLDFLLRQVAPKWPRFWKSAAVGGWERGCALLLRLQQALFATPGLIWPEPDPSADVDVSFIRELGPLLLADTRSGREGRLTKEIHADASALTTAGLAMERLFAPRSKVATLFPVAADSGRAWFYYPAYWWWLLRRRVPQYLRARRNPAVLTDERVRDRLETWLKNA